MAYILAMLAVSVANLEKAMRTARNCGDFEWVKNNQEYLRIGRKRMEALVKVLRPEIIAEAREITNAPI